MFAVILCTTSPAVSESLARALVEEKLVACVNATQVTSFFKWEGQFERDDETLLIIKTRSDLIKKVIARINELHSYEVPEIIALPIADGNEAYLDWIRESLDP